ncbi:4Fe-4S binding protein [Heyndrickxia sporothermodurans]|uniref:4Fe-4S dicluster domain-containing protein n=1 Tax=Bacillaceae TaxID=186817 RepID=UPI001AEE5CB0|nr:MULTISPECIES: 4Fe-4S binding protein [Bacillaceae]MEB6551077.1 4Fe-4S binding protein [Heyndrickxia sporothermodurans]MED3781861.1 4Fe-4S binding protein [Heyndrickxia sporothermodurans]QTR71175.1 4Fe-4S binding protein [Bacillus cytotoxicus]HDR7314285.1 4Fe-4S binding protein [Bacillus cytotoxicus]
MSKIFKQKELIIKPKLFCPSSPPKKIIYKQNQPANIIFENGEGINGSCLHCPDTPCLKYQEEELKNTSFPLFPQDTSLNVCPTEAITLDVVSGSPTVDPDRCIACGLCASRCPSGAIYFETIERPISLSRKIKETVATVNTAPNKYVREVEQQSQEETLKIIESNKLLLESLPKEGAFIEESDEVFKQVYNKIIHIKVDSQFPNILTRNLLIQLGISCSIRRKGDVNLRMDGVLGHPGISAGVLEVELAPIGILDSPRNMLDNIAVLNSRYGNEPKTLTPLVVSMSLPNSRTEYYRVINDINKVLDIKINTLTIAALFILVWNNKLIDFSTTDFYVDSEQLSIRENMINIVGRELNLSEGFFSILEPEK